MKKLVCERSPLSTVLLLSFIIRIAGSITVVLSLSGVCLAASFDCNRAITSVEKLICAECGLSQLDENMSRTYRDALRSVRDPDGLKQEQTKWIREVRDRCTDRGCMEKAYRDRISALERLLPATRADQESECGGCGEDFPKEGERSFQFPHEVYHCEVGIVKSEDELLVWNKNPKEMCFCISTIGTDYQTCCLDGKATAMRKNEYIYVQNDCYINFIFRKNKVEVNVTGLSRWGADVCKSAGCGMNAAIDSATYVEAQQKQK